MVQKIVKKFKQIGNDRFFLTVIIPIIIFWLIFYLLGYPNPNPDDLFFLGPPINLAEKGELVNPFLRFWHERGHDRYFLHPPFYAYTLGAWLSIWGIHTKSILFFHCLSYIASSIATALIFKKYEFAKITNVFITIIFALNWMNLGSRYDALGTAFFLMGICFLTKDSQWRYFWGFSFLGAAILTTPVIITYAVPFAGVIVISNYLKKKEFNKIYIINRIVSLGLAFIFIFSTFLIFINFQLGQFLDDISWHATVSGQVSSTEALLYIWDFLTRNNNLWFLGLLYLQYFILLIVCIFLRKDISKSLKYFLITINIAMFLNIMLYVQSGGYSIWIFMAIMIIITNIKLPKKILIFLYVITFCLFTLSQTILFINIIGRESVNQLEYQEIKNKVEKMTNKTIFVDEVAARFVFDYQLPKGAINWGASNPPPRVYPTSINDKKNDQVWVISSVKKRLIKDLPDDFPRVEILGRKFNSIPSKPYQVIIVE